MCNLRDLFKKGDFVLIHSPKNQTNTPYCIIHVDYTGIDGLSYIHGTIIKTNLRNCLFTDLRYYSDYPDIVKIIDNKSEIEELSLIYKLHLLKES